MQPTDFDTCVERALRQLGYPPEVDRKDLWSTPRAPLGVPNRESGCIKVAYFEGLPRAVVSFGIRPKDLLDYVTGPEFSRPPSVALAFDDAGEAKVFTREADQFREASVAPNWKQTLVETPGCISPSQAKRVIEAVADSNREWFQDSRSKKVVGVLPRIFPEGTVVLYELLQNASDSGATEAAFHLESDALLFSHDGFPFTENDVDAISFVNSSTKPLGAIGFMGIGFKAAYEISDQPEVHSPPFCFKFDGRQEGGELLPIPTDCTHASIDEHSTLFKFPLKEGAKTLIAGEFERFDGRTLLYIGDNLRRIKTPRDDFRLREVKSEGQVKILEVSDSESQKQYALFSRELEPSLAAMQEFATNRNIEFSQLEGRKQRISIATPMDNGVPDATLSGRLQVYLPTDVELPLGFDVQGNFLVGASRKELRRKSGPWNQEHFRVLPLLMADVLEWGKSQASFTSSWATWYDLIPDWRELEKQIGPYTDEGPGISPSTTFAEELSRRQLIPAIDNQGLEVFAQPEDVSSVGSDLQTVLSASEIARLSSSLAISPSLSEMAKERLGDYVKEFGLTRFKASIEDPKWEQHIDAFSDGVYSREGRRQLAKVLAYLEQKLPIQPEYLRHCNVILTHDRKLRAPQEENAPVVRTLPDGDISFPTEELLARYDIVHQRFRRELNRPGDMNLDPIITRAAVRMLNRIAPVLDPVRIAEEIILPLFGEGRWQQIPDERLHRYTSFLMQHSRETMGVVKNSKSFRVKVRGASRQYISPSRTYFGREYSLDGGRLDGLCANAEGVNFLSSEYLEPADEAGDNWLKFFSELGVTAYPRVQISTRQIHEMQLDELRKETGEPRRTRIYLRASYISGIKGSHYALDDFKLDPPILQLIRKLYSEKPPGWKNRLGYFAELLEAGWTGYENKLNKKLRYARLWSSNVLNEQVSALSSFAKFLKEESWLPVFDDISISRRPSELVLNTEDNRKLASKETPLAYCAFNVRSLTTFLEIKETPPETTPLLRLQFAVEQQEDDREVFRKLYAELANDPSLHTETIRKEFRDSRLIFVPGHDPSYITSKEAVYSSRTRLAPHLIAIGDIYPDIEEFFTETLGIPDEEDLDHFIEFLRDYAWKSRPRITDNLRSSIESCYRRFFNHLNETEDETREGALDLLKKRLGSPTRVFCGTADGWVDTSEARVLYPDTAAYEVLLADIPGVATESHLKRLAQPLSEIRPLLNVLNVEPVSEAVRQVPKIGSVKAHPQSEELGEHLSLLVRKAVAMVERERVNTESASRNVTSFLRVWEEHSKTIFRDVRFHESSPIHVRFELVADGTPLHEVQWGAYVSEGSDHLDIHISDDLIDVFDVIADQLRDTLRLDLLPSSLREEIGNLLLSNLVRLGSPQFGVHLNQRLREKGFPVEEDEERRRIMEFATRDIEAMTKGDAEENTPETESGAGGPSGFGSQEGGSDSPNKGGTDPTPPKTPTPEEILANLPEFDDKGFGSERVVDLSGTSHWENQTTQPGSKQGAGGGFGGPGSFKTTQAHRDAYGRRGEKWVVEWEKRALTEAGRPDLAELVRHRSEVNEGSPWDIESFEKFPPHKQIYLEVKSTPAADNFEIHMSGEQITIGLDPLRRYYIYRVLEVHTSKPSAYIYDFKKISGEVEYRATNVAVTLPLPKNTG